MPYEPSLDYPLQNFIGGNIDFQHSAVRITDPGQNEDMHLHDNCEIYVNVSGNGAFMVEKSLYPITRGDMIITRPNEMHHAVFGGDAVHEHYCIWFPVGENAPWLKRFLDRNLGEGNLLSPSPAEKEKLLQLLEKTEEERSNPLALTSCFLRLLLMIEGSGEGSAEPADLPRPLDAILDELRVRYKEPLRIADVSARHFISQSTLNRLFHTYLRISPHGYLENLRLAEAKRLLAGGADVTEAALECGFTDSSHFILLFRRRFGITPGKYRAAQAFGNP